MLNEIESRQYLLHYHIRQNHFLLAMNKEEAIRLASELRFPIGLKMIYSSFPNRKVMNTGRTGLKNLYEVRSAYDELLDQIRLEGGDQIKGILVHEMVQGVQEIFIRVKRDSMDSTVMLVGLGGKWGKFMKDTVSDICPSNRDEGIQMLKTLKGYPLLQGCGGGVKGDIPAIVEVILQISRMFRENRNMVELVLDPVIVKAEGQGCMAVDACIFVK